MTIFKLHKVRLILLIIMSTMSYWKEHQDQGIINSILTLTLILQGCYTESHFFQLWNGDNLYHLPCLRVTCNSVTIWLNEFYNRIVYDNVSNGTDEHCWHSFKARRLKWPLQHLLNWCLSSCLSNWKNLYVFVCVEFKSQVIFYK